MRYRKLIYGYIQHIYSAIMSVIDVASEGYRKVGDCFQRSLDVYAYE